MRLIHRHRHRHEQIELSSTTDIVFGVSDPSCYSPSLELDALSDRQGTEPLMSRESTGLIRVVVSLGSDSVWLDWSECVCIAREKERETDQKKKNTKRLACQGERAAMDSCSCQKPHITHFQHEKYRVDSMLAGSRFFVCLCLALHAPWSRNSLERKDDFGCLGIGRQSLAEQDHRITTKDVLDSSHTMARKDRTHSVRDGSSSSHLGERGKREVVGY